MPTLSIPPGLLSSRNYPGFLGALFLVLLRIAIGWHFLTEGLDKVESTRYGKNPFSAEIYLRNASGPLAPTFRSMLPDADGRDSLDPAKLKASWAEHLGRIESHFKFNDQQKAKVKELLDRSNAWADVWFNAFDNKEAIEKYMHELAEVERTERDPNSMSFERERAWESRRSLEADRRKLTAPLVTRGQELTDAAIALASSEQQSAAGAYSPPMSFLDVANFLTMYGLCAMGVCLILGFLTPFAAVCAAAFLAMIYLSMPPWPGLPPNPKAEGHYWIVSKNMVELIACLLIAVTASGHWFGLDALFFGARRRRSWERHERRLAEKYGLIENEKATVESD
ncbi:MAG: DoxX family protein [Isosphaeraceae bacterium]